MAKFVVEGGHRLKGEIVPQGAKNEALQIICAALLTKERVVLHNVPIIADVMQLLELMGKMGVVVEKLSEDSFALQAENIDLEYLRTADYHKRCRRLRGSVMMIGPLLARYGVGFMPKPGGDKIGRRRLDTHFLGFQKLGATFNFDISDEFYTVEAKRLKGTYMLLDEASVTGTANIVMAAVLAEGRTTIYNAACEPYLQQLCKMLNRMGAKISGIASNLLVIDGVDVIDKAVWDFGELLLNTVTVEPGDHTAILYLEGTNGNSKVLETAFSCGDASEMNLYSGELHAHTGDSDGVQTVKDAYKYARDVAKLDFFSVTDHSNSFKNGVYTGTHQTNANNYNDPGTFVALYGYEQTYSAATYYGHLNTLNYPSLTTRSTLLEAYYGTMAKKDGSIVMFNHPGYKWGNFCEYEFWSRNSTRL